MKRLICFSAIFLFLVALTINNTNGFFLQFKDIEGYSLTSSELVEENFSLSAFEAAVYSKLYETQALNMRCYGTTEDVERFCDNMDVSVVEESDFSNVTVLYGYSSKIRGKCVTLKGRKVNIQIAKRGGSITVGTPLISVGY